MAYAIDVLATQRNVDDVAILAGHFFEEPGRVFPELGQNADEEMTLRAWRFHSATIIASPAVTTAVVVAVVAAGEADRPLPQRR
jgi:hypothetical protein